MQRRAFILTLAGGLATALPAVAAFSDDVVVQLAQQGYQNITVSTTWLGRVRILAVRDGGTREIVLNPRTGEILRDLWTAADGTQKTVSIVDDVRGGDHTSASGDGSGQGSSDGTSGSDTSGTDDGSSSGGESGSGDGASSGGSDSGGSDSGSSDSGGSSSGTGDGSTSGDSSGGSDDGGTSGGSTGGSTDGSTSSTDDSGTGTGTDSGSGGREDDGREDDGKLR